MGKSKLAISDKHKPKNAYVLEINNMRLLPNSTIENNEKEGSKKSKPSLNFSRPIFTVEIDPIG